MGTTDISLEAFQTYLLSVKSPVTAKRYAEYAGKFLGVMRASGYDSFAKLPPDMLSEFAAQLSRAGNKPNTVKVYTFAAKKYLEWVARRGVAVTAQHKPELPRVVITKRDVLRPEMLTAYFRQADVALQEPLRTAVMLLPCCGLRAQEIVSLELDQIHKSDVKLENGKTKRTLFFRFIGKGGKERNVPLMEEGAEILTGYLIGYRKKQRGKWLFPSNTSDNREGLRHISDRGLRNAVQKVGEVLGQDFSPHTMRRTYITTLHRKGVSMKVIADIAGHANIQTTYAHYIILDETDTLEAFQAAGGSLTG